MGEKFRAVALQYQAPDESAPRTYYAQPSKPFEMRQRNAKTMGLLEGFKRLATPEQAEKLRPDLSNGRIFFERTPLAECAPGRDTPSPRMEAVQRAFPNVTREMIQANTQEAMEAREKARKRP